jgi:hypothetical protein
MVTHIVVPTQMAPMKTTIEISDPLLLDARHLAAREGVTLRAIVERGLHRVISEAGQPREFKLRDASFKGEGLQPEFRDSDWAHFRDAIYEDRGA